MKTGSTARSAGRRLLRTEARARYAVLRMHPAKLLLLGYLSYIVIGWILLCLPFMQRQAVPALDNLFIATSAVSTTGLVTVDPGASYSFAGEVVILLLMQVGGLGYMTISTFAVLALHHRLGKVRERTVRAAFNLPDFIQPGHFVRSVLLFTLVVEFAGTAVLWPMFTAAGVENPLWSALFHAVSAFCTAGFSLNPDSFEGFRAHAGINIVLSLLSLAGAMGFLVVVDIWRGLTGKSRELGFTSKIIFRMTGVFLIVGTLLLLVVDPTIAALPLDERVLAAFFQVMTASTTVGFDTQPIASLAPAAIVVLIFLMVIGASPAGTGGGLKTTSFAALLGLVRSSLKGRDRVRFFKREVPEARLQAATASLAYYMALMIAALFLLLLTEKGADFLTVFFEVVSAMGTVGLSMGLTGNLTDLGKIVVIVLMTAGRVGILTFGIALSARDESREEEQNNELVL